MGESTDRRRVPSSTGQQNKDLMLNLLYAWVICWTHIRIVSDLRRHDAHGTLKRSCLKTEGWACRNFITNAKLFFSFAVTSRYILIRLQDSMMPSTRRRPGCWPWVRGLFPLPVWYWWRHRYLRRAWTYIRGDKPSCVSCTWNSLPQRFAGIHSGLLPKVTSPRLIYCEINIAHRLEIVFFMIRGSHHVVCPVYDFFHGFSCHYSDVIISAMASRLLTQAFGQVQTKENIKAPRHCPLRLEFTGGRGHKGPVTRKMFTFDDVFMPIRCGLVIPYSVKKPGYYWFG